MTVDAGAPTRAIAWSLAHDADPEALKAVFADSSAGGVIDAVLDGRGATVPSASLVLRPEWTHRAVTVAVDELCPFELDETTLLLDLVEAEERCGDTTAAAAHVALTAPYLEALLEDAADGAFADPVAEAIRRIGRAASQAVEDTEWGVRLADLTAAVTAGPEVDDTVLEAVVDSWRNQIGLARVRADHVLGRDADPVWVPETVAEIDPAALRPRRARWSGAETAELVVARVTESEGTDPTVTGHVGLRAWMPLSTAEAADPGEIDDVRFYATTEDGAEMVRIARMRREGRDLVAEVHVPADMMDALSFGVIEDARGLGAIRVGERAGEFRRVDRYMIDAWSSYRAAGAARALGSDSDRTGDDLLDEARRAGRSAETVLRRLAGRLGDAEDGIRAGRRAESVAGFLESVEVPPGAGQEPLLAEMLPAEDPDADPDPDRL